jgi:4'-phosphopantetheinyl transferase
MNQAITGNTAGADVAIFADPCAHQATIPYHNWRACKHSNRNQALNRINQPQKQERIKKFAKSDDAKRVLLGDILIRSVVASELKVSSKIIEFNSNKYDKLFIKGNSRLYFNVSHSGDWIVCAIDDEPVGIDIEK